MSEGLYPGAYGPNMYGPDASDDLRTMEAQADRDRQFKLQEAQLARLLANDETNFTLRQEAQDQKNENAQLRLAHATATLEATKKHWEETDALKRELAELRIKPNEMGLSPAQEQQLRPIQAALYEELNDRAFQEGSNVYRKGRIEALETRLDPTLAAMFPANRDQQLVVREGLMSPLREAYDTRQAEIGDSAIGAFVGGGLRGLAAGAVGLATTAVNQVGVNFLQDVGGVAGIVVGAIQNIFTPGSAAVDQDEDYVLKYYDALTDGGEAVKEVISAYGTAARNWIKDTPRMQEVQRQIAEYQAKGSQAPFFDFLMNFDNVPIDHKLEFLASTSTESIGMIVGGYLLLRQYIARAAPHALLGRVPGLYPVTPRGAAAGAEAIKVMDGVRAARAASRTRFVNTMGQVGLIAGVFKNQSTREIMYQMDPAEFMDDPHFREYLSLGYTPEQARHRVIADAARRDGAVSAAINSSVGIAGEYAATAQYGLRLGDIPGKILAFLSRGRLGPNATGGAGTASTVLGTAGRIGTTAGVISASEGAAEALDDAYTSYELVSRGLPYAEVGPSAKQGALIGTLAAAPLTAIGSYQMAHGLPPAPKYADSIAAIPEARKREIESYYRDLYDGKNLARIDSLTDAELGYLQNYLLNEAYKTTNPVGGRAPEGGATVGPETLDLLNALRSLEPGQIKGFFDGLEPGEYAELSAVLRALNEDAGRTDAGGTASLLDSLIDKSRPAYQGKRVPVSPLARGRVNDINQLLAADPNADIQPRGYTERKYVEHYRNRDRLLNEDNLVPESAAVFDALTHNARLPDNQDLADIMDTLNRHMAADPAAAAYIRKRLAGPAPAAATGGQAQVDPMLPDWILPTRVKVAALPPEEQAEIRRLAADLMAGKALTGIPATTEGQQALIELFAKLKETPEAQREAALQSVFPAPTQPAQAPPAPPAPPAPTQPAPPAPTQPAPPAPTQPAPSAPTQPAPPQPAPPQPAPPQPAPPQPTPPAPTPPAPTQPAPTQPALPAWASSLRTKIAALSPKTRADIRQMADRYLSGQVDMIGPVPGAREIRVALDLTALLEATPEDQRAAALAAMFAEQPAPTPPAPPKPAPPQPVPPQPVPPQPAPATKPQPVVQPSSLGNNEGVLFDGQIYLRNKNMARTKPVPEYYRAVRTQDGGRAWHVFNFDQAAGQMNDTGPLKGKVFTDTMNRDFLTFMLDQAKFAANIPNGRLHVVPDATESAATPGTTISGQELLVDGMDLTLFEITKAADGTETALAYGRDADGKWVQTSRTRDASGGWAVAPKSNVKLAVNTKAALDAYVGQYLETNSDFTDGTPPTPPKTPPTPPETTPPPAPPKPPKAPRAPRAPKARPEPPDKPNSPIRLDQVPETRTANDEAVQGSEREGAEASADQGPVADSGVEAAPRGVGEAAGSGGAESAPGRGEADTAAGAGRADAQAARTAEGDEADTGVDDAGVEPTAGPGGRAAGARAERTAGGGESAPEAGGRPGVQDVQEGTAQPEDGAEPDVTAEAGPENDATGSGTRPARPKAPKTRFQEALDQYGGPDAEAEVRSDAEFVKSLFGFEVTVNDETPGKIGELRVLARSGTTPASDGLRLTPRFLSDAFVDLLRNFSEMDTFKRIFGGLSVPRSYARALANMIAGSEEPPNPLELPRSMRPKMGMVIDWLVDAMHTAAPAFLENIRTVRALQEDVGKTYDVQSYLKKLDDVNAAFNNIDRTTRNGEIHVASNRVMNPLYNDTTAYIQNALIAELRTTRMRLAFTTKVTGDLDLAIIERRAALDAKISDMIPETKEAHGAYKNPDTAKTQRLKAIRSAKFILGKQIDRLVRAAGDFGPGVDPRRAILLVNFDSATFAPGVKVIGLADNVNSHIYVARPGAMGYSATTGVFAHESEHMANFTLIDMGRLGSRRAVAMLNQMRKALGLPDFDVLDAPSWRRGEYKERFTEQLAWAFERFLLELGGTVKVDRLDHLELEYFQPYIKMLDGFDPKLSSDAKIKYFTDMLEGRFEDDPGGTGQVRLSGYDALRNAANAVDGSEFAGSLADLIEAADVGGQPRQADLAAGGDGRRRRGEVVGARRRDDTGDAQGTGDPGGGTQRGSEASQAGVRSGGGGAEAAPGDGGLALDARGRSYPGDDIRALDSGLVEESRDVPFARELTVADEVIAESSSNALIDDADADPGEFQKQLDAMNGIMTAKAPKKGHVTAVPESQRNVPVPRLGDLVDATYRMIMADRRSAAAQYDPAATEYAPVRMKPSEKLGNWHGFGSRLGFRLEDRGTYLREWAAQSVTVDGLHTKDLPFNKALSAIPGRFIAAVTRMSNRALAPLAKRVGEIAKRTGLTQDEVFVLLDYAPTAYHTLTEGTQQHRKNIGGLMETARTALEKAEARGDEASATRHRNELRIQEERLRLHDEYQLTEKAIILTAEQAALMSEFEGEPYEEGQAYVPRVISGIPEAKLRRYWTQIQEFFTEQEIMDVVNLTTAGYRTVVEEQLRAGTLDMEDVNQWPEYLDFVALNLMRNTSSLQGSFPRQFIPNPRRTDHRRQGSRRPAAGGMTNLFKAVNSAAEMEARVPFNRELTRLYENSRDENGRYTIEDKGLKRATLNRDETGFVERKYKDGWPVINKPGWIVRIRENGRLVAYKYFFDFKDQAETQLMEASISETIDKNLFLDTLRKLNSFKGMTLTRYRAAFAPGAMVKDLIERFFNQFSRDRFRKEDGSYATGPQIARMMGSMLTNMSFIGAYMKRYLLGREPTGEYGAIIKEFEASEANFSISTFMKQSRRDTAAVNPKEMMKSKNAFFRALGAVTNTKGAKAVGKIIDGWNNGFGSFGAALQYAAMRKSGLGKTDAANYTLEMMNYYKKGSLDSLGTAAFVFYRPIMQGGANMMRALLPGEKTTKAAKWRGAVTYAALTAMAFALQGILRSLGDDDEDGINRYDALPFETVGRNMVVPLPGGGFAKLPVAFGPTMSAWTSGTALHRMSMGLLTPQQTASHMMLSFMRQTAPDTMPGYAFSDAPASFTLQTFAPFIIRPIVDVSANKDFFGQQIVKRRDAPGLWDYEKGSVKTAPMWHNIARFAAEHLGMDEEPEVWRHFMREYFFIPLEAVFGEAANKTLLPDNFPTAKAKFNRFFAAAGLDAFYSAEADTGAAVFYNTKDRFDRHFRRTGIRTEGDELGSTHEDKVRTVMRNMRKQGYTAKEARAYGLIMDAGSEIEALERDFGKAAEKKYRYGDIEPSGAVQRKFQGYADKIGKIYERTGSKLHALNLFEEGLGSTARDRDEEAA